jgi:hypothetical protein
LPVFLLCTLSTLFTIISTTTRSGRNYEASPETLHRFPLHVGNGVAVGVPCDLLYEGIPSDRGSALGPHQSRASKSTSMDSPGGKFMWSAGGTHLYAAHRLQGLRPCPWTGATAKPNLSSLPSRRKVKDVLLLAPISIATSAPQSVNLVLTVLSLRCVLICWFMYTYHPLA